jgi:hypothetical protein
MDQTGHKTNISLYRHIASHYSVAQLDVSRVAHLPRCGLARYSGHFRSPRNAPIESSGQLRRVVQLYVFGVPDIATARGVTAALHWPGTIAHTKSCRFGCRHLARRSDPQANTHTHVSQWIAWSAIVFNDDVHVSTRLRYYSSRSITSV